jgi:hypothetical protein
VYLFSTHKNPPGTEVPGRSRQVVRVWPSWEQGRGWRSALAVLILVPEAWGQVPTELGPRKGNAGQKTDRQVSALQAS